MTTFLKVADPLNFPPIPLTTIPPASDSSTPIQTQVHKYVVSGQGLFLSPN